jgi:hypothetical protein
VVPDSFDAYFTAAASAAGALIGLLFVAISLRPDAILGEKASARARSLAGSSFTGLVNGFFVSMAALIPGKNLGGTAIVLSVVSLASTFRLHRQVGRSTSKLVLSALTVLAFAAELAAGIGLVARPHKAALVTDIAWITIASFAVALMRAWSLLQGKDVEPAAP